MTTYHLYARDGEGNKVCLATFERAADLMTEMTYHRRYRPERAFYVVREHLTNLGVVATADTITVPVTASLCGND